MLKTTISGDAMIFRKDFDDRQAYSTTISKKDKEGNYENSYIDVKFKKGVELANKTNIGINNAWLTFYISKEKKPVWQIFVNDFQEYVGKPDDLKKPNDIPEGFAQLDDDFDSVPF
jgi:hypothetical protein